LNELVSAGELQKIEPDIINTEFTASYNPEIGTASGYFCKRCEMPLLVGDKVCPGCQWVFNRRTPPRSFVETKIEIELRQCYLYERTTAEEIQRSSDYRKKRRYF
jgi:hypothetical protein